MSKVLEEYLTIKNKIDNRYKEKYKKLANHLLDVSFDWYFLQIAESRRLDRANLQDYMWTNCLLEHKDLDFSFLYYCVTLKRIINWISDEVLKLD